MLVRPLVPFLPRKEKRGKLLLVVASLAFRLAGASGLARVLLHDPQVLLLDEPASGLDPRARIEMRNLLKRLQGMGKTITFADEKNGYTISDRGTYIAYKWGKTPAVDLDILFEGDAGLANPYGVIPVNPKKFPHVKYDLAQQFADWLVSPRGQKVIADFKVEGKQLFFPDAIK